MSKKLNKRTLELEKDEKELEFKSGDKQGFKRSKRKKFNGKKVDWKGKEKNDPSWWLKNEQMVKDAASIPFNHMAGFPLSIQDGVNEEVLPMTITYLRSFIVDWFAGISKDFRSILNNASTNLWSFIRARNSGATNYQASDILLNTVFAAVDFFCNVVSAERLFKFHKKYVATNRLLPKMIFQACGIDYEDFISNIARYRLRLNVIIAKASSLVIPNEFPFISQAISQYADVFKDRDSDTGREQLYIKVKAFHHIFDPTFNSQGGGVRLMVLNDITKSGTNADKVRLLITGNDGSLMKFDWLLRIMEMQLEAMVTDEDTNIMFGDLIKAFGDTGNFFKMNELPEEVTGEFTYSEEILEQIHNSYAMPSVLNGHDAIVDVTVGSETITTCVLNGYDANNSRYANNIYQDAQGYILTYLWAAYPDSDLADPQFDRWSTKAILDSNEANPDAHRVMNMTRWATRWKSTGITSGHTFEPVAIGASVIFDGLLFTGDVSANTITRERVISSMSVNTSGASGVTGLSSDMFRFIADSSHFDWAPLIYIIMVGLANARSLHPVADINNITTISVSDLDRIHNVAFLSLYDIPKTR